ncbi:MAG: zinc-dependent alcohol dehydrogenase family protein [Acidimicrobiia bacterium]|nr:MAG: zinc-dependent alcohol dehydrogenase family protein [Acidimicrobiia bacterium]
MRAAVYHGAGDVRIETLADPEPVPGEVLLEVRAAGICGTDRHIVAGELGVPDGTVPGHEIAGVVAAVTDGVEGVQVGDRVLSYGQVTCGSCGPCTDGNEHRCRRPQVLGMTRRGGFAERVAVPHQILIHVPDAVPDEIAAIVPDAIATPYHALVAVGGIEADETVVIIGAGGLGMQAIVLARMLGAERVVAVDPSEEARAAAREVGADAVFDPTSDDKPAKALYGLTGGATLTLECVGRSESVELGMDSLKPGGRLVIVGVGFDRPRLPPLIRFVAGETQIRGSFGSTMPEIKTVLELITDGTLDVSRAIAQRIDIESIPDVFRQPPAPGRTVIVPRS